VKVEWRLLSGIGIFVLPFASLYWVVSDEPAGSVILGFFIASLLFLGGWLWRQSTRLGSRPEDRPDAGPGDAAGDIGYFPPRSGWPVMIGVAATLIGLGIVFSRWVALPGVALLGLATVGYGRDAQLEDAGRYDPRDDA
jgi:hypothetical protein